MTKILSQWLSPKVNDGFVYCSNQLRLSTETEYSLRLFKYTYFNDSNLTLTSAALLSANIFSQTKNPYKALNSFWKWSEVNTYGEKKDKHNDLFAVMYFTTINCLKIFWEKGYIYTFHLITISLLLIHLVLLWT